MPRIKTKDLDLPDDAHAFSRGLSLRDYIPEVVPKFSPPDHLAELVQALEDAITGRVKNGRYVVTVPMRHGKTETILSSIAWGLYVNPILEFMYITYNASFSQRNSRRARQRALFSGVQLATDHNTVQEWATQAGGNALFTGVDGQIAGRPADVAIFDDPIKSREVAESFDERDKAFEFLKEVVSRLNDGGSIFLVSARWHVDDPSGRCLQDPDWKHIYLPALFDEGLPTERPLWPEQRPLSWAHRTRKEVGKRNWASWFQGQPFPPDSNLFQATPGVWQSLPLQYQIAIGIDLGFTKNGDFSIAYVVAKDGDNFFVIERRAWQKRTPVVAAGLVELKKKYPSAEIHQYVSGPEVGTIDLIRDVFNVDIVAKPARFNKFVRAMATAEDWNSNKFYFPDVVEWGPQVTQTFKNFTGEEGGEDNDVDALVAARDALCDGAGVLLPGFYGKRSW